MSASALCGIAAACLAFAAAGCSAPVSAATFSGAGNTYAQQLADKPHGRIVIRVTDGVVTIRSDGPNAVAVLDADTHGDR